MKSVIDNAAFGWRCSEQALSLTSIALFKTPRIAGPRSLRAPHA